MATTNSETFTEIVLTSPDGNVGVEISLTGDSQHISLVAALLVHDGVGGGWAMRPYR